MGSSGLVCGRGKKLPNETQMLTLHESLSTVCGVYIREYAKAKIKAGA